MTEYKKLLFVRFTVHESPGQTVLSPSVVDRNWLRSEEKSYFQRSSLQLLY